MDTFCNFFQVSSLFGTVRNLKEETDNLIGSANFNNFPSEDPYLTIERINLYQCIISFVPKTVP